jgi:hypothetical protein
MADVDLTERKKTHGDFSVHARITQGLKRVIKDDRKQLLDIHSEAIDMILHKIGRICAGDPNVHDHWDDIAGYARITSERIPER